MPKANRSMARTSSRLQGVLSGCTVDYLSNKWHDRTFVLLLVVLAWMLPMATVLFSYISIAIKVRSLFPGVFLSLTFCFSLSLSFSVFVSLYLCLFLSLSLSLSQSVARTHSLFRYPKKVSFNCFKQDVTDLQMHSNLII